MNKRSVYFWGSIVGWLQAVIAVKVKPMFSFGLQCVDAFCIDDVIGVMAGLGAGWILYRLALKALRAIDALSGSDLEDFD